MEASLTETQIKAWIEGHKKMAEQEHQKASTLTADQYKGYRGYTLGLYDLSTVILSDLPRALKIANGGSHA